MISSLVSFDFSSQQDSGFVGVDKMTGAVAFGQ